MKKLSLIFLFVLLVCNVAFAQEPDTDTVKKPEPTEIVVSANESERTPEKEVVVEKKGCCSHHGGVCGCENGRAKCCDGSLSPSCGCD